MLPRACVDVFMENKNARKVDWAVHVGKIRVIRLVVSRPSWDFLELG